MHILDQLLLKTPKFDIIFIRVKLKSQYEY